MHTLNTRKKCALNLGAHLGVLWRFVEFSKFFSFFAIIIQFSISKVINLYDIIDLKRLWFQHTYSLVSFSILHYLQFLSRTSSLPYLWHNFTFSFMALGLSFKFQIFLACIIAYVVSFDLPIWTLKSDIIYPLCNKPNELPWMRWDFFFRFLLSGGRFEESNYRWRRQEKREGEQRRNCRLQLLSYLRINKMHR